MNTLLKLPPFKKYLDVLNDAGIETRTARQFWGGVTADGEIILTAWIDANDGTGRFYIGRPKTNHGGLKTAWEVGNIRIGTEAHLILLRQRGNLPVGENGRSVAGAAMMPGKWRVVKMVNDRHWQAEVESIPAD